MPCDNKKMARNFLAICGMINMQLWEGRCYVFCRKLEAFEMHLSIRILLLMFSGPSSEGAAHMALMLGH
jgi:hypothetical protein